MTLVIDKNEVRIRKAASRPTAVFVRESRTSSNADASTDHGGGKRRPFIAAAAGSIATGGEHSHRDGQRRRPWCRGAGRFVGPLLPWYALLQWSHAGILPVLGGFRLIVVLCRPPAPEDVIRARPEIVVYVVNITRHVLISAEGGHHKILSLLAARNDTKKSL